MPINVTVLFEDVQPSKLFSFPLTFRVQIQAESVENWFITAIELPSDTGQGWVEVKVSDPMVAASIRSVCWDYATSHAGYEAIETKIAEGLREDAERSRWDAGDVRREAA